MRTASFLRVEAMLTAFYSSHNILQTLLKTSDPPGRNMTFQTPGVLTSQPDVDDPAAPHVPKLRRGKRRLFSSVLRSR